MKVFDDSVVVGEVVTVSDRGYAFVRVLHDDSYTDFFLHSSELLGGAQIQHLEKGVTRVAFTPGQNDKGWRCLNASVVKD